MPRYTDRDTVKSALGIPATATGDHLLLDMAIENVSRLIDDYCNFVVHPQVATNYFTAQSGNCLYLETPLLAVTRLRTDLDGDGVYETSWTSSDYWLAPYNAPTEYPPKPYWTVEARYYVGTKVFPSLGPSNVGGYGRYGLRGVEIAGLWGYTNQTKSTTATVATGLNATTPTVEINGATSVHPGNTLSIGNEQLFVREVNANTSQATVERGANGTSGATCSSGTAIAVYDYGLFGQAALYQAGQDFRSAGMPMGVAGGEPFGTQAMRAAGGLHPFVRRMLDPFRRPLVG